MPEIDFDRPATLQWIDVAPEDFGHIPGWHGSDQPFPTLREAVRFCVEDLDMRVRNFASIAVEGAETIASAQIEALYALLQA